MSALWTAYASLAYWGDANSSVDYTDMDSFGSVWWTNVNLTLDEHFTNREYYPTNREC